MTATQALLTAEELLRLSDDGRQRYELVKGVLVAMPPPGFGHGSISSGLSRRMGNTVEQAGLGGRVVVETGFQLTDEPDTVRSPDVAYVSAERLPTPDRWARYFLGAPDIAAEVVSPFDMATEVQQKVLEYLAAGSRLVWILEPRARTVTVYRGDGTVQLLREEDMLSGEDVLLGFNVRVGELWT